MYIQYCTCIYISKSYRLHVGRLIRYIIITSSSHWAIVHLLISKYQTNEYLAFETLFWKYRACCASHMALPYPSYHKLTIKLTIGWWVEGGQSAVLVYVRNMV